MKKILIIVCLMFTVNGMSEFFRGKCVGVADGDTIKVMRDTIAVKVRLQGIDCPEKKQPFWNKAKRFTSKWVMGKVVKVEVKGKDQYGRILGEVFVGKYSLNVLLVENGLAWHYTYYSDDERYVKAEAKAREEKAGLWVDKDPVAPWEWRKTHRD